MHTSSLLIECICRVETPEKSKSILVRYVKRNLKPKSTVQILVRSEDLILLERI